MEWNTSSNAQRAFADPKISVNKLGEYMVADSGKREAILKAQKNPPEYSVTRYNGVREAICDYFVSSYDHAFIDAAIASIGARKVTKEKQEEDKKLSVEILKKVSALNLPDLKDLDIKKFNYGSAKMVVEDVTVNVNPDLIITGTVRGKKVVGAIKLHIVKKGIDRKAQEHIASVLHSFVERFIIKDDEIAKHSLCFSLDVYSDQYECAPKAVKDRWRLITAACREIASRWNTI